MRHMMTILALTCVFSWAMTTAWFILTGPEMEQERIQKQYNLKPVLVESVQVSGTH